MQACAQALDVFTDCGLGNILEGYSREMSSRILRILAPVAAVSLLVASAPAAGAASYDLSKGSATGMSGVSPFAMEIDGNTDRVFHSAGEAGGWLVSVCTVGGNCTQTSLPPDFGTDFTQVTLADRTQRAYFVIPEVDGSKEIATAPVTYVDGTPTLGEITRLGFTATANERAWGVPDSVVTPDGLVRLYWVAEGKDRQGGDQSENFEPTRAQQMCMMKYINRVTLEAMVSGQKKVTSKAKKAAKKCGLPASAFGSKSKKGQGSHSDEVIVSATSTDPSGTSFTQDAGYRTTGGYVDSDVIQAKNGDWLMLLSTGPGDPPQRLFVATSRDGLKWKVNAKPLTPASFNALDPTAVQLGPKKWRVYYAKSPKKTPFSNHRIVVGELTR